MKPYQIDFAIDAHGELYTTLLAHGIPLERARDMADSSMPVLAALAAQYEPRPCAADYQVTARSTIH
jgi:hypothetical protein